MFTRMVSCLALALWASVAGAEETKPAPPSAPHTTAAPVEFDSFILVLLVRPPNAPDRPKAELEELQAGHMANMKRLADEGKLFKAGPTEDFSGRNVRGIFILKTHSVEQAKQWVATDPSVKSGRPPAEHIEGDGGEGVPK